MGILYGIHIIVTTVIPFLLNKSIIIYLVTKHSFLSISITRAIPHKCTIFYSRAFYKIIICNIKYSRSNIYTSSVFCKAIAFYFYRCYFLYILLSIPCRPMRININSITVVYKFIIIYSNIVSFVTVN